MSDFVLIDWSSWIRALRANGDPGVRARVKALLADGKAAWCEMVRVELWAGVRNDQERNALQRLDATLPRIPVDQSVWDAAASYGSKARAAGITVPAADLVIFACAAVHDLSIEHTDQHYELLKTLK